MERELFALLNILTCSGESVGKRRRFFALGMFAVVVLLRTRFVDATVYVY